MNLQLNDRANASPSVQVENLMLDTCKAVHDRVRQLLTLPGDLSLALQITLVADNHHGEVVLVLDSQDLLLESCDFLEALS